MLPPRVGMIFAILTLTAVIVGAASAQTAVTVAGSLASVAPTAATIATAAGTTTVIITNETRVSRRLPATLADIKPGSFLAVTSSKAGDGTLTAVSISIIDAFRTTARRANYTMESGNIMTNADVTSVVTATSGRTIKMAFEGQAITILVPDETPVRRIEPATIADLKVGQHVTVRGSSNGGITAMTISID